MKSHVMSILTRRNFSHVVFLRRIRWHFRASDNSRFGTFREGFMMTALLAALAAVPATEAVKMLSSGAMLAIAVFTAAKIGRGRRRRR
jgi:hypothetical protein